MRILACPDKFRGTCTALEAAAAVARGARHGGSVATVVPLADGGEGTLECLAAVGGVLRRTTVSGPLGDPVEAQWLSWGTQAFIEMAQASGLVLVGGPQGNDALGASTYGTGELIAAAMGWGARTVTVTLGGSATTDGGFGALRALEPLARLTGIRLVAACDVATTFVDAAAVFGPQKGASPAEVGLLRRRLERLADLYRREYGVDVTDVAGSGAAGGLAGALVAVGAELRSGFALVADMVNLAERIDEADLIVTGEGFLDHESFHGKVVGGVCELAVAAGKPVLVVVGQVLDGLAAPGALPLPGGARVEVVSLVERFGADRSCTDTAACIEEVVRDRVGGWHSGPQTANDGSPSV